MKSVILPIVLLISVTAFSSVQANDLKYDMILSNLNQVEKSFQPASPAASSEPNWNSLALASNEISTKKSSYSSFTAAINQKDTYQKQKHEVGSWPTLPKSNANNDTIDDPNKVYSYSIARANTDEANGKRQAASQNEYVYIDSNNLPEKSNFLIANRDVSDIDKVLNNIIYNKLSNKNMTTETMKDSKSNLYAQFESLINSQIEEDKYLPIFSTLDNKLKNYKINSVKKNIASSRPPDSINNLLSILERETNGEIEIPSTPSSPLLDPLHIDYLTTTAMQDRDLSSTKNYAVVIGINEYNYRSGLRNSDNDAKLVSSILKTCGYDVIELTDISQFQPTRHNILDGALAEISQKRDKGNIIIYFSGHGELDDAGNSYLVPQDADGNQSSFISAKEIKERIKDFKNLALIIDACNSGGFETAISDNQIMIASSMKNESSSEEWIGSYSIFTYNLCNAIKESYYNENKISLELCFKKAYKATTKWSRAHLLSQTPTIVDRIYEPFYLN